MERAEYCYSWNKDPRITICWNGASPTHAEVETCLKGKATGFIVCDVPRTLYIKPTEDK